MTLRRAKSQIIALILLLVFVQGCSIRLGDFTTLTSKNINVSGVKRGERVTGADCVTYFLTPFWYEPNWESAMDAAIEQGEGDVLIDVVMVTKKWWFIMGQNCIQISGNVSQTASYQ